MLPPLLEQPPCEIWVKDRSPLAVRRLLRGGKARPILPLLLIPLLLGCRIASLLLLLGGLWETCEGLAGCRLLAAVAVGLHCPQEPGKELVGLLEAVPCLGLPSRLSQLAALYRLPAAFVWLLHILLRRLRGSVWDRLREGLLAGLISRGSGGVHRERRWWDSHHHATWGGGDPKVVVPELHTHGNAARGGDRQGMQVSCGGWQQRNHWRVHIGRHGDVAVKARSDVWRRRV
mmetsp:Transcript_1479/g.4274  ORF Transcript_1479/g.4274 Transcript_1479/m.4274 type:complete len:232 (+) Transcript_1479:292-987(+)